MTPNIEAVRKRLAEIRERAEKATPGEWRLSGCDWIWSRPGSVEIGIMNCTTPSSESKCLENGQFIAASRTDVPALLALVEALLAEREAAFRGPHDAYWQALSSCDAALARFAGEAPDAN